MREAEVPFNDETRLMPLVGAVFVGELDGFEVTPDRVEIVKTVGLEVLEISGGSHRPIVINQPPY